MSPKGPNFIELLVTLSATNPITIDLRQALPSGFVYNRQRFKLSVVLLFFVSVSETKIHFQNVFKSGNWSCVVDDIFKR